MGVSAPSLHRESTDSMIEYVYTSLVRVSGPELLSTAVRSSQLCSRLEPPTVPRALLVASSLVSASKQVSVASGRPRCMREYRLCPDLVKGYRRVIVG